MLHIRLPPALAVEVQLHVKALTDQVLNLPQEPAGLCVRGTMMVDTIALSRHSLYRHHSASMPPSPTSCDLLPHHGIHCSAMHR